MISMPSFAQFYGDGEIPYRCLQHPALYFNDVKDYNLHREIDHDGKGVISETNEAHSYRLSKYFERERDEIQD